MSRNHGEVDSDKRLVFISHTVAAGLGTSRTYDRIKDILTHPQYSNH